MIGLVTAASLAQGNPAAQAAREWRQQHEREIADEFIRLLAIPNITRDRDNIQRNADLNENSHCGRGLCSQVC